MRHINYFKRAFFILMALCITGVAFGQDLLFENISNNPNAPYGLEGPVAGENFSARYAAALFPTFGKAGAHEKTLLDDFPIRKGYRWNVDSLTLAVNLEPTGTQEVYWRVLSSARTDVTGSEGYGGSKFFPRSDWDEVWGDLTTNTFDSYRDTNIVKKRYTAKEDPTIVTENLHIVTLTPPTTLSLEGIDDTYWFEFYSNEKFSAIAPSVEEIGNYASTGNGLKGLKDAAGTAQYKILNDGWDAPAGKSWQGVWFKVFGQEIVTTAPLAASGLNLNATDNNALTATLSWTNPTTDGNGDALVNTSVHVVANGNIIHTQDLADATSNVVVNLPDHGQYDITIVIENEVNKSRPSNEIATPFVGTKPPVAASAFTAVADAAPAYTVQIAWTNPTTNSFDNGALEALDTVFVNVNGVYTDTIAYVGTAGIDNPDETLEVTVDSPGDYDFSIVARNAGGDSETALESTYVGPKTPAAIADLDITVDNPAPARDLTFTWTNPTDNVDGVALTQLNTVYVLFGTDTIKTYDSPVLGEAVTFNYTATISGELTFTVVAKNDAGESSADFTTAWVGSKMVAAIADADVQINAAPDRNVTFTWTNPTEDVEGNPITEFTGVIFQTGPHWVDTIFYASVAEATAAGTRTHTVEVPDAGDYGYKVWVFNSTGKERSNVVRPGWIGPRIAQNPTELAVQANTENLEVNLRWINPSLNDQDDALTEITAIMVMNGADTLATITDTEIGQRVTDYMITVPEAKIYNFHLVAVNAAGVSAASNVVDAWVGPTDAITDQTPVAATDLEVVYSGQNTNVTLNWTNPTVDIYGNTLVKVGAEIYANGVKVDSIGDAGTYSYDVVTPGNYTFSVKATADFVGEAVVAEEVWCGVKGANPTLSNANLTWTNSSIGKVINKEITLQNLGIDTLSVSAINFINNAPDFGYNFNLANKLAYNDSYTFYISYKASSKDVVKDSIVIVYGAGALVQTDTIALEANGAYGGFGYDFEDGLWDNSGGTDWKNLPSGIQTEDGFTGLTQINVGSDSYKWERYRSSNFPTWATNQLKYCASVGSVYGSLDDYLISSVIKPTANDTLFKFKAALAGTGSLTVKVLVSEDRTDFTGADELFSKTYTSLSPYQNKELTIKSSLASYIGVDSIYVAIHVSGAGRAMVDDIYAPFVRRYSDIKIKVEDPNGNGIPNFPFVMEYAEWDPNDNETFFTNDTGGVVLENYLEREYAFRLKNKGYARTNGNTQYYWTKNTRTAEWNNTYVFKELTYLMTFNVADELGNAIEGAEVIFGNDTLYTGAPGQATFANVPHSLGEKIAYKVSYGDLKVYEDEIAVWQSETFNVTLKELYDYNFNVSDGVDPIELAEVTLGNEMLTTDVDGNVTFSQVTGTINYSVSADRFFTKTGTVDSKVSLDENVVLDYKLYDVYFTYTDGTNLIEGATIDFNGETQTTDANGEVVFYGVNIDTHDYTATLAGYMPQAGTVNVVDWDVNVAIETELVYEVAFSVSDGINAHVGATVDFFGLTQTTDANGDVTFANIPVGTAYPYSVSTPGYLSVQGTVDVVDQNELELVTLDQAANVVTFNVADDAGVLSGVLIAMNNETRTTDISGTAQFTVLDGEHNYTVSAYGYDPVSSSINVAAGNDETVNINMDSISYVASFKVTDENGDVEGASIAIDGKTLTTLADGTASVELFVLDGSSEVKATAVSNFDYTVSKDGYHAKESAVDIAAGDAQENVTLELVKYAVNFTVTNGTDVIEGATILIEGETLTTNVDGEASINLVPGVDYAYTVSAVGYFDKTDGKVTVVDADVDEAVALVLEAYAVTFNVTDENGNVEAADVYLNINEYVFASDANGVATANVVPGVYNYEVKTDAHITVTGTITVTDAVVEENVTLTLNKYTATFVVSNENGFVEGASIAINGQTLTTDAEGKATFTAVPETYEYTITAADHHTKTASLVLNADGIEEAVMLDLVKFYIVFNVSNENGVVEGASIAIEGKTLTTDAEGMDSIYLVPGTYTYTVTGDELHTSATGEATTTDANISVDVNLPLVKEFAMFTVTNNEGKKVEGATVSINDGAFTLTTDVDGFDSVALVPGTYSYAVTEDAHFQKTGEFTIVLNGGSVAVAVVMDVQTHQATFNVANADGTKLENAAVTIGDETINTDANGKARFNLASGTYSYTVVLADYTDATGSITIDGTAIVEAVTLVEANPIEYYKVKFVVTNSKDDSFVSGAVVSFINTELTTDINGEVEFAQVSPVTDATYTVSKDGEFISETGTVSVVDADVTENVAITPVGVNENSAVSFNVYPNPAKNYTVIEADNEINKITIISINGQVTEIIENVFESKVTLDISNYTQGVYYLYVDTTNGQAVQKLIVN